jgi:hypothetical protein
MASRRTKPSAKAIHKAQLEYAREMRSRGLDPRERLDRALYNQCDLIERGIIPWPEEALIALAGVLPAYESL